MNYQWFNGSMVQWFNGWSVGSAACGFKERSKTALSIFPISEDQGRIATYLA
jgi:hypothetical protein